MAAKPSGVSMTRDGLKRTMSALDNLVRKDVLVGVPAEKSPRRGSPIGNAALAYIHDNGAPDVGIPARSFMRPGIKQGQKKFEPFLHQAAAAALAGDMAKADRALHAAGIAAASAIRMKIRTGPFEPLKQATVNRRRIRSKGSSYRRKASSPADVTPLIDTAQMLRAITHVVRTKKS